MKALIICHDRDSLPVLVGKRLEHHGYELDHFYITFDSKNPSVDVTMPDPSEYDLVVPMGSIWSVYDEEAIGSWIHDEFEMLRSADRAGIPIMGICFGAQALAAALGGEVIRSETPQLGWYNLTSEVPEGIVAGPWFQWHFDRFTAPPGAEILAHDEVGTQAFRLRRNLGVQFHPEVTTDHVRLWLSDEDEVDLQLLEKLGFTADGLVADCEVNVPIATPNTNRLVDWFLSEIAEEAIS